MGQPETVISIHGSGMQMIDSTQKLLSAHQNNTKRLLVDSSEYIKPELIDNHQFLMHQFGQQF
jgi:hypothetical protein